MLIPIKIQIKNLIQVCIGKNIINKLQEIIPNIGITGCHLFLKVSWAWSLLFLKNITPKQTITNADNVPILTISAKVPKDVKPATVEINMPQISIVLIGEQVANFQKKEKIK